MAKRTKEELLDNLKSVLGENTSDEALSLIEDLTDSLTPPSVDWEKKYNENDAMWRQKYRDRFYSDVPQEEPEYERVEEPAPMKTKFEELFS